MKCQLITFLIFASVAQCFCDQSSVAPDILSDSDSANFLKIQNYYNTTIITEVTFFGKFFDLIANRVVLRINNATSASEDEAAENSNLVAPAGVKVLVSYSIDAILVGLGVTTCDAATENLDIASSFMVDALQTMTEALTLAGTSNGSETASAIEEYRILARSDFLGLIDKIVACIFECRNETSAEVLEVIELGHRRTDHRVLRVVDVAFHAIQEYAAAVAQGNVNMRLLTKIEGSRAATIFSDMSEIDEKFALITAIFTYYHQTTDVSIADLYLTVLNKTGNANATAIVELTDLTAEDAATDRAIAKWKAGTYHILQTTKKLSARTRKVLALFIERLQAGEIVVPDASNAVAAMGNMTTEVGTVAVEYTVTFFNALFNDLDVTGGIKYKFTTLKTAAKVEFKIMTIGIAKAIDYLADAASKNETANLVSNIYAEQNGVTAAVRRVSDILSS